LPPHAGAEEVDEASEEEVTAAEVVGGAEAIEEK